jgi:hypothetical protein
MKKIILQLVKTDGYTYWFDELIALEYESVEKMQYELMDLCFKSVENKSNFFKFLEKDYDINSFGYFENEQTGDFSAFKYVEPIVLELEEWFFKKLNNAF